MKARPAFYLRGAAAAVALSGLLLCAPMASRGDDSANAQFSARAIVLPMMRAGGIPQGQVLQITERGSTFVAAVRPNPEAATPALTAAQALRLAKTQSGLLCAGTM